MSPERRFVSMGLFFAGLFIGVLTCVVGMMVRCVMWYQAKHPEDDYWHRKLRGREAGVKGSEQGVNGSGQESLRMEVEDAEGH